MGAFQFIVLCCVGIAGLLTVVCLTWLFYDIFIHDPFSAKRREKKKEIQIYTMEERPWPRRCPFGGDNDTETKEDMICRLWSSIPEFRDLLLKHVKRIRLANLYCGKVSHFILLYTTDVSTVFAGPPVISGDMHKVVKPEDIDLLFDVFATDEDIPNLLRRRRPEMRDAKVWPDANDSRDQEDRGQIADFLERVYKIHDGFGVVLHPEQDLWTLAEEACAHVRTGSTWYLLPRRSMWQVPPERLPVTEQSCVAFGRVDRNCDAVSINGEVAFYEHGELIVLEEDERISVNEFVKNTLLNLFKTRDV